MRQVVHVVGLWLVIASAVWCGTEDEDADARVVRTAQGAVRGHRDPETGVFTFYGIPYATVPIKSHRFQAPLPGPAWLQTLDAVDKGIVCPQPRHYLVRLDTKLVQEDCLIANVYVPDTTEKKLPVVVYVHGGAYQIGFGNMFPPINFVKAKNVIAVTFNYRLGLNGFLCLGTKDVPGNAGLKDQLALLRWVNRNIANFGGNPDDVTIAGGSAGAVSVDLLMLSKTTKGLFNKVIPESGASIGHIAIQIDPVENAKNFAMLHGFPDTDDIYALEKFYQDSVELVSELYDNKNSTEAFVPCVERDTGRDVFLDEAPYNILRNGKYKKLPMLFGFANMEGIFKLPKFNDWKTELNEKFSDFLPADLQFESENVKQEVAEDIREFYFDDIQINEESILEYINYFTDIMFGYPTLREVRLHAEAGNDQIYLYEYSFVDDNTLALPHTTARGANHCAQTIHVLDAIKFINPLAKNASQEYNELRDMLQDMWYNFITTGKPVPEDSSLPEWPAANTDRSPHMSLGTEVVLRGPMLQKRAKFWDKIYSKYYRVPLAPPKPPPKPHSEL